MSFKYKKIIIDLALNMAATAFPTVVLNFIIYPWMAQQLSDERYGIMLTILSAMQLVYGTLGYSLNNVRLIKNIDYEKKQLTGDFNIFVLIHSMIAIVSIIICTVFLLKGENFFEVLFTILSTVMYFMFTYLEVQFRLVLNFKSIMLVNTFMTIGYFIGYGVFLITGLWSMIYFMSALLPFLYTLVSTNLLDEPFTRTPLFASTAKDICSLNLSGFCTRFILYADKILLFPLLGGEQVAIYHAGNFVGKMILMAAKPINGVLLSYLAKLKKQSKKAGYMYLASLFILCLIGYAVCRMVSEWLIGWRYPQYVDEAMHLIPITTLNLCILTYANFITPVTMKFCKMVWQVVVNAITVVTYVVSVLIFYRLFGIEGFCLGVTLGYAIKLLLLLIIYISPKTKTYKDNME